MAYYFRVSKCFAFFNVETLTILAYFFRDSKYFAKVI